MPHARVNGIGLYYEDAGDGPPLLLIMGRNLSARAWAALLPALTPHHRVVSFDNRGCGRSDAPPGPYTTRLLADDVAALLDHLAIPRAHVAGVSLGGMVAQELALAHPRRVDCLALISTLARMREAIFGPWLTYFQQQAYAPGLDPAGRALWALPWAFTPAFLQQPALVEAALHNLASPPDRAPEHGSAAQDAAARAHDTRDRLRLIAAPTLVLVGAEDILTPPYYAEELAAGIPGARLQVLARGGHGMVAEYPGDVAAALLAFLAA
jgi:3-oxoadipate enol-lactonase